MIKIKNSQKALRSTTYFPKSKDTNRFCWDLVAEGFLKSKKAIGKNLVVNLKYSNNNEPAVKELSAVSTGQRLTNIRRKDALGYKNNLTKLLFKRFKNYKKSEHCLFIVR